MLDASSRSALEFARQINSPKLKKKNPAFKFELDFVSENVPPLLTAEFVNGSKYELDTSALKAQDIRKDFFGKIEDVENEIEMEGAGDGGDDAPAAKSAPKKK